MAKKQVNWAQNVCAYMEYMGYELDQLPGCLNIIYIEGINPDFTENQDHHDRWNDLSLLIEWDSGDPKIIFSAVATTEPGNAPTHSKQARLLGGVARIAFGQHRECWRLGYHNLARGKHHPALVQCAPVKVHRDYNRDYIRTNDPIDWAKGLNQHGTWPGYNGDRVGQNSAGCLVRRLWRDHIQFIEFLKTDARVISDWNFKFSTTIIPGGKFLDWVKSK